MHAAPSGEFHWEDHMLRRLPPFPRTAVSIALAALLAGTAARAQNVTTTLRGKVTDEQGAALTGAAVTAANAATNEVRGVPTVGLDRYFIPTMPAGPVGQTKTQ